MPTKIAINGFGRTGRMFFRAAIQQPLTTSRMRRRSLIF
jgi:glyceraldehyde-3-phosphate dehydrogenase/erythrose-4-phosphate dehydrogenase